MKISIITTTYNSASTVRDTFESVLLQTYTDIEYIVVDGASKDDTLMIIQEYAPRFKGRMRYISEPNNGIYDAMNKGIRMSTGEIVGILNSDDFYTFSNVVERLASELEAEDVDAVYGDIHYVENHNLQKCVRYHSSSIFRRSLMRFGFMPAHSSFYCKRAIYEKYGIFDTSYKVAADFDNLLRLIFLNRIRVKYVAMDCVAMRLGGTSSSGWRGHKQIIRDRLKVLKNNGVYSNIFLLGLRYVYKISYGLSKYKCGGYEKEFDSFEN